MRARTSRSSQRPSRPAAFVKSRWRDVVADANTHGEVLVTNHDRPEVVVLSLDRYDELQREASTNDPMADLRAQFDRELAWLREPGAGDELRRIFNATPADIARAANAAALKRKKK